AWAAVAILLIAAPSMGSPAARYWIVGAAVVVFGFAAIANAWATRGRFFGWAVLTAVVGLAVAGVGRLRSRPWWRRERGRQFERSGSDERGALNLRQEADAQELD